MITAATATELLEVLRTVLRAGRVARTLPPDDGDLPGWTVALLGLLERTGEQRLGQLAAHLEVDVSVVSRQVATLVATGLITRRPDPVDGRAQLLAITDAGRAAVDRHRARRARWVAEALAGWEDDEVRRMAEQLRHLVHDLSQALADRPHAASGRPPAVHRTR